MQIAKQTNNKINVIIISPPKTCFSHRIPASIKGVINNTSVLVVEFVAFCHTIGNKWQLAWREAVSDNHPIVLLIFQMTTATMVLEGAVSKGGDVSHNRSVS